MPQNVPNCAGRSRSPWPTVSCSGGRFLDAQRSTFDHFWESDTCLMAVKETYWTQGAFDSVVGRLQLNLLQPCVTLGLPWIFQLAVFQAFSCNLANPENRKFAAVGLRLMHLMYFIGREISS